MSLYRVSPRARLWVEDEKFSDEYAMAPDLRVDGPAHVDTGLITATGDPIYRVQAPIGFGREDER